MPEWHSIQFVWPRLLWLLATLPLWLGLYIAWQARGVQRAWPSASMNTGVSTLRFTRHAPALLVLLGLAGMLLAMARPQAILLLPSRIDTVMLAIDSSGSMRAGDECSFVLGNQSKRSRNQLSNRFLLQTLQRMMGRRPSRLQNA